MRPAKNNNNNYHQQHRQHPCDGNRPATTGDHIAHRFISLISRKSSTTFGETKRVRERRKGRATEKVGGERTRGRDDFENKTHTQDFCIASCFLSDNVMLCAFGLAYKAVSTWAPVVRVRAPCPGTIIFIKCWLAGISPGKPHTQTRARKRLHAEHAHTW